MTNSLNNILAIDVETSGPSFFKNELLSISLKPLREDIPALSLFLQKDLEKIQWGKVGKEFFAKYEDEYLKKAINQENFCSRIEEYLFTYFKDGAILTGHNVGFDYSFLLKTFDQINRPFPRLISHRLVDTHSILMFLYLQGRISQDFLSSSNAFKLVNKDSLEDPSRHTAEMDAILAKDLLLYLVNCPPRERGSVSAIP